MQYQNRDGGGLQQTVSGKKIQPTRGDAAVSCTALIYKKVTDTAQNRKCPWHGMVRTSRQCRKEPATQYCSERPGSPEDDAWQKCLWAHMRLTRVAGETTMGAVKAVSGQFEILVAYVALIIPDNDYNRGVAALDAAAD